MYSGRGFAFNEVEDELEFLLLLLLLLVSFRLYVQLMYYNTSGGAVGLALQTESRLLSMLEVEGLARMTLKKQRTNLYSFSKVLIGIVL